MVTQRMTHFQSDKAHGGGSVETNDLTRGSVFSVGRSVRISKTGSEDLSNRVMDKEKLTDRPTVLTDLLSLPHGRGNMWKKQRPV